MTRRRSLGSSLVSSCPVVQLRRVAEAQQAPTFKRRRRPRQPRRDGHRQEGRARHRSARPTTSRSTRTAGSRRSPISPPATRHDPMPRRRCTSACCSTSARAWARTCAFTKTAAIKFLNTLTDAVDITVVDFDTEVRVGALRPARLRARSSSASGSRRRRLHGALRRHRRLSRRRRRSRTAARSCCSTPTAATRAARCRSAS